MLLKLMIMSVATGIKYDLYKLKVLWSIPSEVLAKLKDLVVDITVNHHQDALSFQ